MKTMKILAGLEFLQGLLEQGINLLSGPIDSALKFVLALISTFSNFDRSKQWTSEEIQAAVDEARATQAELIKGFVSDLVADAPQVEESDVEEIA